MGTSNLTFVNGTAIFRDLAITLPGNDYIIDFNITYPPEAANYSLSSRRIKVRQRVSEGVSVSVSVSVNECVSLCISTSVSSEL